MTCEPPSSGALRVRRRHWLVNSNRFRGATRARTGTAQSSESLQCSVACPRLRGHVVQQGAVVGVQRSGKRKMAGPAEDHKALLDKPGSGTRRACPCSLVAVGMAHGVGRAGFPAVNLFLDDAGRHRRPCGGLVPPEDGRSVLRRDSSGNSLTCGRRPLCAVAPSRSTNHPWHTRGRT